MTLQSDAAYVLAYLSRFRSSRTPLRNTTYIAARLKDKNPETDKRYTAADLILVIDWFVQDWMPRWAGRGLDLSHYLHPSTIFGRQNFRNKYYPRAEEWAENGRVPFDDAQADELEQRREDVAKLFR